MDDLTTPDIPDALLHPTSCLIGYAGTGKSYLAKAWAEQDPSVVLAATTGIAATNLGAGTTLNALLGYFDTASLIQSYTHGFLEARLGKLWRSGVRRILIDEVSMMDAEQLTVLTQAAKDLGRNKYTYQAVARDAAREDGEMDSYENEVELDAEDTVPPVAITLVGDFCQLPPVKAKFAFTSPAWPEYAAHLHKLTTIRRQTDQDFIQALHAARRGDPDPVCDFFGPRLESLAEQAFDGTTIVATNDTVDRINSLRMARLTTAPSTYAAGRWGKQRGDWKNIPDRLELKPGALVMILANKRESPESTRLLYANGDLGHVGDLEDTGAWVTLQRTGQAVFVSFVMRPNTIPLEPGRTKALKAENLGWRVLPTTKSEIIGTVEYLPLRAAWASTVHKCQGLSFDTVQVSTHEHMFRQPGLLYVALSRARTAAGLRLVGTVDGLRARVSVDPLVTPWL